MGEAAAPRTDYVQSPEQRQMYKLAYPIMEMLSKQATMGRPAFTIPQPWQISNYQIPDISTMMPTAQMMQGIAPEVQEAAWYPYREGADILTNQLAGMGALGVPGAMSPAAGAAMGRYYADVAPNVTNTLLGMILPATQAGWQAQLQQNMGQAAQKTGQAQTMWQTQLQQRMMPFSVFPGQMPSTYSQPFIQQQKSPWDITQEALGLGMGGAAVASLFV